MNPTQNIKKSRGGVLSRTPMVVDNPPIYPVHNNRTNTSLLSVFLQFTKGVQVSRVIDVPTLNLVS